MLKLSKNVQRILRAVELDPDRSAVDVARTVGVSAATVQYHLSRLKEGGTLVKRYFIDPFRLGFMDFGFYFSLNSPRDHSRRELIRRIRRDDRVAWMGPLLGDFQYQIAFYARWPNEFTEFIDRISSVSEGMFSNKMLLLRTAFHRFPRSYLEGVGKVSKPLVMVMDGVIAPHDALDRRILSVLGADGNSPSVREVARTIGEPFSTVERRISRMRETGIIRGAYFDLRPHTLGVEAYRIVLSLRDPSQRLRERIRKFCEQHQRITFLLESLGSWDFEVGVEVEVSREVQPIVDQLHDLCGLHLGDCRVVLEVDEHKVDYFPFGRIWEKD